MVNALAREFHTASLLRFALPTVLMNLFVGLYYIVDGVCVARFASTDALSAMNITYPTFFTALAISIMLATGGSAVVAKKMGEGHGEEARGDFSFLALLTFLVGLAFSIACLVFIRPLLYFLGASDVLYPMSRTYLGIQLCFTPAIFLQMFFQTFFVTAGKPKIGCCYRCAPDAPILCWICCWWVAPSGGFRCVAGNLRGLFDSGGGRSSVFFAAPGDALLCEASMHMERTVAQLQ